ncbi:acyl-CoA N-acyltransferase [Tricladium varicosporioides]|nr:acyl-CoA N-acyltransferase [Hymenoscyphus varicosporioides]
MSTTNSFDQPVGDLILDPSPSISPKDSPPTLTGKHVTLRPLSIPTDTEPLFTSLCIPSNDQLWTYIPGGPFRSLPDFTSYITALAASTCAFVILTKYPNEEEQNFVGIITLMSIVPTHQRIEIGHVFYGRELKRTTAATEVVWLLMRWAFGKGKGKGGYGRVEWKCDSLNGPSRRAAERLGFRFEGTFLRHMLIKGRRRDTAWFSVLLEEWEGGIEKALESWLEDSNFDERGVQKQKLEDIRDEIIKKNAA